MTVRLSTGVKASPALKLSEVSSVSGTAPSASAAGWSTGKTPTSTNWSAMTLVTTLLNATWLSPGARKPVPLTEETSLNFSAGLAFTPVDNLTVTADYFHIRIDDRIILGATFDEDVERGLLAAAGFGDIGGVQYFTNGLDTRTQGVDLTGSLRVPAGASGTLDLNASLNFTKNDIVRLDSIPALLRAAGSTEPGLLDTVSVIAIEDERPDWRATMQGNYTIGRLSALGRFSYYGGFSSAQPGFCDLCRENYGGKGLVDAELGYQFNLVKLALGVRNLFDTYPDQPSSDRDTGLGGTSAEFNNNFGTFPWAAASPFGYNGRFAYARTEIQLDW